MSDIFNGLQADAPEGACHENVKSLGKKYHSTVGVTQLDFHLQIFRHIAEEHMSSKKSHK